MEIKDFDRRFHKKVFFNRLGIGIYSFVVPVIIFIVFLILSAHTNIFIATDVLIYTFIAYIIGFIIYSILLIILDKKVIYEKEKIHRGYKTGFAISKAFSFIQLAYCSSFLIITIIIGLLGSALEAGRRYDIGDQNNLLVDESYNLDEYNEYNLNEYEVKNQENIKDFVCAKTQNNRFLNIVEHTTIYIKYDYSNIYSVNKSELIKSNNYINKSITDEYDYYIYPVTTFKIDNFTFYVCESNYLSTLKVIGYSDIDLSLVILSSDGSTYDHFGKDVKVAEQAFIDYIKNTFYLPWYENKSI